MCLQTGRVRAAQLRHELAVGVGEDGVELDVHRRLRRHDLHPEVLAKPRLLGDPVVHAATRSQAAAGARG